MEGIAVALVPRDDVDVNVGDDLAGAGAVRLEDVEAVRVGGFHHGASEAREQARAETREDAERRNQAQQILESGRVSIKSGRRRFYYESRDGRVPYLEMDEQQAAQIEKGALALCETPDGRISLANAEEVAPLAELAPEWLRAGR